MVKPVLTGYDTVRYHSTLLYLTFNEVITRENVLPKTRKPRTRYGRLNQVAGHFLTLNLRTNFLTETTKMDLRTNIPDNWEPSAGGFPSVDWKEINLKKLTPFQFYFLYREIETGTGKDGKEYELFVGDAQLDTTGLTEGQVTDRANETSLSTIESKEVKIFRVGSMMETQIRKSLNEVLELGHKADTKEGKKAIDAIDWRKEAQDMLLHIRYMGKKKSDSGVEFHQVWIDVIPQE